VNGEQYLRVKASSPHARRRREQNRPHVTSQLNSTMVVGFQFFALPAVEFHLGICPTGDLERPFLDATVADQPRFAPTSSVVALNGQLNTGELAARHFAACAEAQPLRTRRARNRGHRSIIRKRTASGGSCGAN